MIVNCVAYRGGRRLGNIPVDDISEVLKEPETFIWLGVHEPDIALLRKVQEEFSLHELAIEDAIANLKTATEGEDADDISAKTQALAEASMKLGQAMYEAAQSEQANADAAADAKASGEEVVDADFEEIDDEDKKKSA